MAEKLSVKVVTPNGKVVEGETDQIVLRTVQGEITVLPEHSIYTSILGAGILRLTESGGTSHEFVATGGFCSVSDNKVLVLTDTVDYRDDIDASTCAQKEDQLTQMLTNVDLNEPENQINYEQLMRYQAQAELISH